MCLSSWSPCSFFTDSVNLSDWYVLPVSVALWTCGPDSVHSSQMGSNKFSVLALFSFIMPASLQLAASMMFSVQRMANGPYGLLFALFVLFYRTCLRAGQHTLATTPLTLFLWFPTRRCCSKAATAVLVGVRYECVGQDSDILVWASGGLVVNANAPGLWFLIPAPCQQLMLNDGWSSFIPALTGIVAGLIFFSEAVPMSNVLIPAPIANFFSVCKKFAVHLWGREAVDHFFPSFVCGRCVAPTVHLHACAAVCSPRRSTTSPCKSTSPPTSNGLATSRPWWPASWYQRAPQAPGRCGCSAATCSSPRPGVT